MKGSGVVSTLAVVCAVGGFWMIGSTESRAQSVESGAMVQSSPSGNLAWQRYAPATAWQSYDPGKAWLYYRPGLVVQSFTPAPQRITQMMRMPISPANREFGTGRTMAMIKPWLPTSP